MGENQRQLARDARRVVREGPEAIARVQRARLAEIVAHARAHSPYYRELYQDLPDGVDDPALLPVTDKKLLMARFDDWATDRAVTLERVQEFVADPGRVGQRFQGRYLVATTSGTSGVRGLFVIDEHALAVHTSLGARSSGGMGVADVVRLAVRGGRTAVVSAPHGHFFTVTSTVRFALDHPRFGRLTRIFPVDQPLPELAAQLTRHNPAILSGFLSMLVLLAGEQEAGRLRIRPALVIAGGETATPEVVRRLATAFHTRVRTAYAATECGFLSFSCDQGWYHVNSDWAVVEPVDAEHRPVPPGQWSHTVLISNLANQVQPILRYDLGDSVLLRPDPCECGSPLPAIRVRGRVADVLTFPAAGGEPVSISPMLFGTLLDRAPGLTQYQLVQTAPSTLRVRLRPVSGADADQVWQTVRAEITHLLAEHRVDHVTLERAEEAPQQSPGGKFRRIIPLSTS
ncbi:phenylacetate--CoA ligase family protein [Goodfellowiella coeruleoviolacea]|uniref:Phenylacetate-coenzyme A ligase PaaK, adenylate-forming domain family n=1 Tax=Goodfellowiella coeruleoviolacea TaxID=334858 RepID=A0AAE3GLD3_9PSEU|nr:phenylacetate--CoA ligase family protein [Goodfellowiella coeruleoviolacea]MCP2169434.1 Phenylacetate-coenzyme A ligase PaaK, adenylate-forming domain family [Goodfellowiella coeruleoviolacea]